MFLKRLLIIFFISIAACVITGRYFDAMYKKNWSTLYFNTTDTLLDKTKSYDIILLGNSRFHFGLNPYYIDSATGLNSYNFGVSGGAAASLELYSLLYLQNHPAPKYVLINADPSLVVREEGLYTQFHLLHYLDNETIFNYLKTYHSSIAIARYLPFFKYCLFNEYSRRSLFQKQRPFQVKDHNIYKGFFNNQEFESKEGDVIFARQTIIKPISDSGINRVKNVVDQFTKAGSTVVLVLAPVNDKLSFAEKAFFAKADSIFESIAIQYNADYFRSNSEMHYDNKYFMDELHLNEPGSRIFSRQMGNYIRQKEMNIKKAP